MFLTKKKCLISALMTLGLISMAGCNISGNTSAAPNKNMEDMLLTGILGSDSGAEQPVKTYDTYKVTTDDFVETVSSFGNFAFGGQELISQPYSHGTISFVKYNVSMQFGNSAYVEEGAPILTLKLTNDPLEREEARIALEKAQSSYRNTLSKKEEGLEDKKAKISEAATFYEQQLLEKDYSEALAEYEEYIVAQDEYIAELQAKYDILLYDSMEFEITAPVTGFLVAYPTSYNNGDIIDNDDYVAAIYPLDSLYISVDSDKFKYGDKVTLSYMPGNTEYLFEGTVVSAGNILYNSNSNLCKIEFDKASLPDLTGYSFNQLTGRNGRVRISLDRTIAMDSIVLPISTLGGTRNTSGKVTLYLEDGSTYETNVKIVHKNNEKAWVMGGVEEGDQILN